MKKIIALLLAMMMLFSLAACGGTTTSTPTDAPTDAPVDEPVDEPTDEPVDELVENPNKVAMITDYGDINDQSFNQNTYEGCKQFCEANNITFQYFKPSGDSTPERVAMVDAAVADGFNIIVMPGYAFGGTIFEVAPLYPDVKFVALDVSKGDILETAVAAAGETYDWNPDNWVLEDYADISNVWCAVYQEELCGYMAGYAAVKLGYTHLGFLGGMAVPAVVRYGYGFAQGVNAAAAEVEADITLEYVYGNQFYGDGDITAYMDTWYQTLGVEVVFACGGAIYTSAAEAAANQGAGKVIGVDVDQSGIIDEYGTGMTVTSAMKGLAPAVQDALGDILLEDKWADYAGKIVTLGLVSGSDPEANYVQIPYETTQWDDNFSQEDYKAMVAAMFDGSLTVSNDISAAPEAANITFNMYDNIK